MVAVGISKFNSIQKWYLFILYYIYIYDFFNDGLNKKVVSMYYKDLFEIGGCELN